MISGIDHDDQYRMVEDEFLTVAAGFTRHLHAAEYQRLKGLAKSENAETIQNISRPVTGEMTDLVRRRHDVLNTAVRQRNELEKVLGKRRERDRSTPPRQPSSLQGLMDSPRKLAVPLTGPVGGRPGSRGLGLRGLGNISPTTGRSRSLSRSESAVQARSSQVSVRFREDEAGSGRVKWEPSPDSDDDDLDGPPRWRHKPKEASLPKIPRPVERQVSAMAAPTRSKTEPSAVSNPLSRDPDAPRRTLSYDTVKLKHNDARANDADEDEDEDFFSRLRARRAEQKRRRETKVQESKIKTSESQAAALNEIPFI